MNTSSKSEKNVKKGSATAVLQNLAYEELRSSLMRGVFAPGEKISLRHLASDLGTSIMPVRAAVNKLIAERAFELRPNRTIVVPEMSKSKLTEITYWRMELESHATSLACDNIDEKSIRQLENIDAEIIKLYQAGDWEGVLSENYKFHFAIYSKAQSTILLPMIENLWLLAGPFTYHSLPSPKFVWNVEEHIHIISALKTGNNKDAAQAMRSDIKNLFNFLLKNSFGEGQKLRRLVPD
ncbi:MAG: hypothetical protein COB49_12200 [Alphaproteobacteria bacterium]|nr:MAG: hypothetical protein COB49_12200 [Alphaproteobacteria bacterium]